MLGCVGRWGDDECDVQMKNTHVLEVVEVGDDGGSSESSVSATLIYSTYAYQRQTDTKNIERRAMAVTDAMTVNETKGVIILLWTWTA